MQVNRNRKCLAAIVPALVAAAMIAPSAPGQVSEGTQIVDARHMALVTNAERRGTQIVDARHMALVANAARHGLAVRPSRPVAGRHFFVGSPGNVVPRATGGTSTWTSPGVVTALSVAFVLGLGGLGVASRRRLAKSRPATA